MIRKRTGNEGGFECRKCGKLVPRPAYRAACPSCGGRLDPQSVSDGRA